MKVIVPLGDDVVARVVTAGTQIPYVAVHGPGWDVTFVPPGLRPTPEDVACLDRILDKLRMLRDVLAHALAPQAGGPDGAP